MNPDLQLSTSLHIIAELCRLGWWWRRNRKLIYMLFKAQSARDLSVRQCFEVNQEASQLVLDSSVLQVGQHTHPKLGSFIVSDPYAQLNDPHATEVLNDALAVARQIQTEYYEANALSSIAEAYAKLDHWQQVQQAVESCPSNGCRVNSLAAALTVWAEQQHPELAEAEEE